jgi:putative transposase
LPAAHATDDAVRIEDRLVVLAEARVRKRYKHTTVSDHDQPIADNLLKQTFIAAHRIQRWVGDTTECVIATSGKIYLAAIVDLFSRFVVGWAVSAVTDLTMKALEMALKRRCRKAGLWHHSDQGSTYAQAVLLHQPHDAFATDSNVLVDRSSWTRGLP